MTKEESFVADLFQAKTTPTFPGVLRRAARLAIARFSAG
jgi:hypothetical protein